MLKTYEKKITLIEDQIIEVFTRLIKANTISLSGVIDKDISRFKEAKNCLSEITKECAQIDNNVTTTLALFSPEAKDLRKLVSYLKVTNGLNKTASNIKSYNKNISKNFESNKRYFTASDNIEILQTASIKVLNTTLKIIYEDDSDILHDLYEEIVIEANRTDTIYEKVEKELLSLDEISVEAFALNIAILKTFTKLDKITSRVVDIATALLFAKLDKVLPQP